MMSKLMLLALLTFSAQCLWARELVIVSDLDETLRMANVEKHFKAGLKLVKGVKPYPALVAIFNDIKKKNPDAKFYYLSNSYPFLYKGKKWIRENQLPEGVVFQRSLKDKSKEFKPRKLKEIAAANPNASYLFFGDNIEHDPKFYQEFLAESKIDAQVFIRDARLIFPIDSDVTYFQTEAQITDDLDVSLKVTRAINALDFSLLVPNFLLKNLEKRLIRECKTGAVNCTEAAENRIQEVIQEIRPGN